MPTTDTAAIWDLLSAHALFKTLSGAELTELSRLVTPLHLRAGEKLFSEGDPGDFCCFVTEGTLDVSKPGDQGEDVQLATLSKGMSIGEMSVIDHCHRSASAVARNDVDLLVLTQSAFETLLDRHPATGIKILKAMARLLSLYLRQTSGRFVSEASPLI